ncbi:dopaminechrome tautomerase-like isoform X2 [Onthophagus taurus]|uniref:dopaminechrome tautomerase-like isoform X2 n=1 Tax=Onthophagus taurus TaxID=166361 RepID=UPI000C200E1F|nr:major royal jelly protein 2-like isoform X2 [Onthophagus taurus]
MRTFDRYLCLILGLCHASIAYGQSSKFKKIYEWTSLDFDYESDSARQHDIQIGNFHQGEIAPIDVDVYYAHEAKPVIFVAIPRFQAGVPVTLGVIQGHTGTIPKIKPYPNWSSQRHSQSCGPDRIISVFRVQVDSKCNKLWVMDTGKILDKQVCPPQIIAFDLKDNRKIHQFDLDKSLYSDASIFVTPIVDTRDNCQKTFVYLADCQAFSIVVYDAFNNKAWKVSDKSMYPSPEYGTYSIQGDSFDLMDGVLGMALEPYVPGRDRKLFFHAMSSATETWVYTSQLRNESLFSHGPLTNPDIFHTYKGKRDSQTAAEGIDKNGVAFFGQMSKTSIHCWNTDLPYGGENIQLVEYNPKTLQFASGLKIVNHPQGFQELWVLTSRFQKVAVGTLNPQEINFRIQSVTTDDAVRGTSCRRSLSNRYPGSGSGGYGGYGKKPLASTDRIIFTS